MAASSSVATVLVSSVVASSSLVEWVLLVIMIGGLRLVVSLAWLVEELILVSVVVCPHLFLHVTLDVS